MSSPAPTNTGQVVNTINQIVLLGATYVPIAIMLWKQWQQSAGRPSADLFDESDVELDAAIKDVLLREEALGYPSPSDAPTGEL